MMRITLWCKDYIYSGCDLNDSAFCVSTKCLDVHDANSVVDKEFKMVVVIQ